MAKAARRLQASRCLGTKRELDELAIFQAASVEHLRALPECSRRFLAVRRDLVHGVQALREFLEQPGSQWRPGSLEYDGEAAFGDDGDMSGDIGRSRMFFRIVSTKPAAK